MAVDRDLIRAMHVRTLHHEGLHRELDRSVLFQASTIGALLDGAYDGDVTFAELAEHGDLGLGTTNALDGEMIALDGSFFRADVDGRIARIGPAEMTPFAVVVSFEEAFAFEVSEPASQADLLAEVDRQLPEVPAAALRIDGRFQRVAARSVPRQSRPYRPLTEVIADQHVFEFEEIEGTVVGFRFPRDSGGIEVSGYHLHFIDRDRTLGGHVLDFRLIAGRVAVDPSNELRVELPPGIDLSEPHLDLPLGDAVRRVEGG